MTATPPAGPDLGARPWHRRLHAALMPAYNRAATTYWWLATVCGHLLLLWCLARGAMSPPTAIVQTLAGALLAIVVSWKADAPSKDAAPDQASDALFAIGGLDAAEFIDRPGAPLLYGLDAPALRVTLPFDGAKKEDWFEIGLKDDAAFARRRDDSAVLKLDKAKTEALIKSFTALGS